MSLAHGKCVYVKENLCLPVLLMQMRAVCLDISSDACHLTQENAERLSLADRLEVYQADVCLDKGFSSSHIRFFCMIGRLRDKQKSGLVEQHLKC